MFRAIAKASVEHPVTVHLLAGFLLVAGTISYFALPREIFPDFTQERVRVTTFYRGASPEDVEELVTVKVEDAVEGVDGIETIESTSQEGVSTVIARLLPGADAARVVQDVDRAVRAIKELPQEIEQQPVVEEVRTRFPVITLSIYGDVSELALKDLIRPIKRRMEAIPGVASARPTGLRELEWSIEVRPEALERFALSLDDVARALRARNLNLPGGALEGGAGELLIRTRGETKTQGDIERVVIRAAPDGTSVTVADVARVVPGFERALTYGRFNGKPALNLTALKDKSGDILEIAAAVRKLARELELPAGVHATVHTDLSVFLRSRLRTMQENAVQGFFLVLLSLCLLLNWRMALLVAAGLPMAFLTTFALMALLGISINMMTLFAMILILGMLVDDAIIVTENIYRRIEEGEPIHRAAIEGTAEVAVPVLATILTTVAAFLPMVMTPGEMGQWMRVVPIVVALCLLASLCECFAVLPCHVAEMARPAARREDWFARLLGGYERAIRWALGRRYVVLAAGLGLALVLLAWASVSARFTLFGAFESDTYFINFELPSTVSLEECSERAREVERIALALPAEERAAVSTNIGLAAIDVNRLDTGSYLGQVVVTFTPAEARRRSVPEILAELRERTEALRGFTKVELKGIQAGPGGAAIEVAVAGDEPARLAAAAEMLKAWLRNQPGVFGVYDDAAPGKRELEVSVDQEAAAALGLTTQAVALEVRDRFQGREATTVRRIDEDVPLVVRLPHRERGLRRTLDESWLTTPDGRKVPLAAVAHVREGRGLVKIVRSERRRAITVLADVDTKQANALQVTARLEERFRRSLPEEQGVELRVKGQRREAEQSMVGLARAFFLALALIYVILGTQFQSFLQPLFVMVAIPFGLLGVLFGHLVLGEDLTFLSMMGVVAVSGIVVNDSLVLVDLVNRLRADGVPLFEACVRGSVQRLRPILLTSITTVLGLFPLAFMASGQARFLSPMAMSILFGISFATVLTLVLIPILYLGLEDLRGLALGLRGLLRPLEPAAGAGDDAAPQNDP